MAFGLFAAAATAYAGFAAWIAPRMSSEFAHFLGGFATGCGLAGIGCSVMIYVDTHRPCWASAPTSLKFFLTALVLGIPLALLNALFAAAWAAVSVQEMMARHGRTLCCALTIAVASKLLVESLVFLHLRQRSHSPLKRSALLLSGALSMTVLKRYFFGVIGGFVLPLVLASERTLGGPVGYDPLFVVVMVALILVLLVAGELLERSLFFTASVAPRMPGGPA
jgi:DMSO reductase anchor subunit